MPAGRVTTVQDAEDLLRGLTLLGTGGGGRPEMGRKYLISHVQAGRTISWVDPSDVADDAWVCSTFGMGSVAPRTVEPQANPPGYGERRVAQPMVSALQELEAYLGIKIGALVASEAGAGNTGGPMDVATRLGLQIVDGDYAGRAIPEASQSITCLHGVHFWPAAICDEWGNVVLMRQASSDEVAEAIGKMVSVVSKAPDPFIVCGFAADLCRGKQMKEMVVPGTLTRSLALGRAIREASECGRDPADAAAAALNGWVLCRGRVARKEWESKQGYMFGTTTVVGSGAHAGHTLKIWFKNENHITWLDDVAHVTSPDLICVVRASDGEPIINTFLAEGEEVAVLGAPHYVYRSPEGLKLMGPRHFGFDLEYRPIEKILA